MRIYEDWLKIEEMEYKVLASNKLEE